jgi:hypothetical protein
MTDRERIARAMYDWDWETGFWPWELAQTDYLERADAVLAVIGDRILPDLPDVTDVAIELVYPEGQTWRMRLGIGRTVLAAVQSAMRTDK